MGALLLALAARGAELPRVVVLDVAVNEGPGPERAKTESLAAAIGEQLLTELGRNGRVKVIGKSDIATILGLERQRELMGCTDSSASCLAEMGGALGAQYIVAGAIARVGSQLRLDIKLLQADRGDVLVREGDVIASEESIFRVVARISEVVSDRLTREVSPEEPAPRGNRPARVLPLVGAGLGAVAAIVGGGLLVTQSTSTGALQRDIALYDIGEAHVAVSRLNAQRDVGVALAISGVAVAVACLLWFVLQGDAR